ncbi:hypothetical protein CC85DRAFT_302985 [Cutaneotrichosporon oleaginosum]|uniref:PHD-type domain-containing protein n=1 Tax=Cutaneotrichosporon oleaginosum TaxID=879819 RepID=A0A0J0XKP1_9TREE|nr:uncharacterized protein CC85DRAFT_302985 [Cutaneotrichosporon oleaginosum]KLT41660.1 hypothetical protein CC85DRAFT_302985 [Cutaneotrichosporon oleaginosum]TXT08032.1 hypothetical protein COLE_04956 [Cutaneotrichosporon oleaginosum]
MNGGLIFESSTHTPLPSAPVLKQELITEHYAITAKRSSQKDKMKRPANINTSIALGPIPPQPSFIPTLPSGQHQQQQQQQQQQQFQQVYISEPSTGLYQQQQQQTFFAPCPPSQPVPGPSRQPSIAEASAAQSTGPPPDAASTSGHSTQRSLDSTSSQHKRKRSNSSSQAEELRTPRNNAQQSLPSTVQGLATGKSHLPTPPSTGDHVSMPTQMTRLSPETQPEQRRSGVYVTSTEAEGRKLGLVRTSTGTESREAAREQGPPRTKQATVLNVDSSGVATVGSGDVLHTDASYMGDVPTTPKQPSRELVEDETPRTKSDKVKRRLESFKTTSRPAQPMYCTRLDMGPAGQIRVALRKDIAVAFMGLDKVAAGDATEETSSDATREPVRPDWPDEYAPWNHASGRRTKAVRQDRERMALLERYFESTSDDDDDHDAAARLPIPTARHQSRPSGEGRSLPPSQDPTDARAALWYAVNKVRRPQQMAPPQMVPTGVISCVCRNNAPSNQMVSCSNCKSWHHVACVGRDEALDRNWACETCMAQARRATLSTPSQRTPPQLSTAERSMSAFRGNQALALAPSPMFAPEAARAAAHSGSMVDRTPRTPNRRHERARVLSYGNEWGVTGENPSTPLFPTFGNFSTPRPDDPVFDVNSTPSRHLDTDPRIAGQFTGSLFAITPLMGRSRNANPLVGDTPIGHNRVVSGVPPAFADGMTRHDFLQGLSDRREHAETPSTVSTVRGLGVGGGHAQLSPSPFTHRRSSSKSSHVRSASRSGLGLGLPLNDE